MPWIIEQKSDAPEDGWIPLAEAEEWGDAIDIVEALEQKFHIEFRATSTE